MISFGLALDSVVGIEVAHAQQRKETPNGAKGPSLKPIKKGGEP
jgi:hypothetical protein